LPAGLLIAFFCGGFVSFYWGRTVIAARTRRSRGIFVYTTLAFGKYALVILLISCQNSNRKYRCFDADQGERREKRRLFVFRQFTRCVLFAFTRAFLPRSFTL
jgi:hypothetical protein